MSGNALRRKTGGTEALITWPITRTEWAGIPATVRERVRDLIDEACDLIELHSQGDVGGAYFQDVGAEYLKTVTKPTELTPEQRQAIADKLYPKRKKSEDSVPLACCHQWKSSRVEADTAPVRHICNEVKDHSGSHRCSCSAVSP